MSSSWSSMQLQRFNCDTMRLMPVKHMRSERVDRYNRHKLFSLKKTTSGHICIRMIKMENMERGNMSDMNERGPHDFSFVLLFNNLHCNKGFLLKTFSSMLSLDCDGADD